MPVLVILLLLTAEPNCETVRSLVTQHGKIAAYAWALAHGISPKEIARIRKQCGL
jgi:hypothetical protein